MIRAGLSARGPGLRTLGAGLLLAALSLVLTAGRGVSTGDESWFLQVAARLARGERLYDEVFYSPLPLAAAVAAVPVAVLGTHIAVVEALVAATWASTTLLSVRVARRFGAGRTTQLLLVGAMVATAAPQRNSLYTPLAMLFLVLCLDLATARRPATARSFVAGVAAGLAFASKQTVGVAAFAALLVALAHSDGSSPRARRVMGATAGFAAVGGLTAAALAATGTLDDAVRSGFTGKGEYLGHGSLSYGEALAEAVHLLGTSTLAGAEDMAPLLVPPLAAVALLTLGRRAGGDLVGPVAFALAAVLAAYPRFGATHLAWANPAALVVVSAAVTRLPPPRWLLALVASLVAAVVLVQLAQPVLAWTSGDVRPASAPAYRGVPLGRASRHAALEMRAVTRPGERVFFVAHDAAFRYLVTGATNPTPWDIPAASNIGPAQVRGVVADVAAGRVTRACLAGAGGYEGDPALRPIALEQALRRALRREGDIGPCTLFVRDQTRQTSQRASR